MARGRTRLTTRTSFADAPSALTVPRISWRVNAERLALLGWGRAILLQFAHPLVAAGVDAHSAFRRNWWTGATRLHSTIHAMLALTFGTDAQRHSTLHGILTIHRRVNGQLPIAVGPFPAGTRYSAEDASLVEWVHLTLLDSMPLVYELLVAPLSDEDRDAYCEEAAWVARALGARPSRIPLTWKDTQGALQQAYASGSITVGPQARDLAATVLAPGIGRVMPPAAWLSRLITVGLLPPHIREQYGFEWTPRRQRALDRAVPLVRALRRRAPDTVALWAEARG